MFWSTFLYLLSRKFIYIKSQISYINMKTSILSNFNPILNIRGRRVYTGLFLSKLRVTNPCPLFYFLLLINISPVFFFINLLIYLPSLLNKTILILPWLVKLHVKCSSSSSNKINLQRSSSFKGFTIYPVLFYFCLYH